MARIEVTSWSSKPRGVVGAARINPGESIANVIALKMSLDTPGNEGGGGNGIACSWRGAGLAAEGIDDVRYIA